MPNIPVYKNEYMIGRYYDDIHIDHETGIGNLTQWYIDVSTFLPSTSEVAET